MAESGAHVNALLLLGALVLPEFSIPLLPCLAECFRNDPLSYAVRHAMLRIRQMFSGQRLCASGLLCSFAAAIGIDVQISAHRFCEAAMSRVGFSPTPIFSGYHGVKFCEHQHASRRNTDWAPVLLGLDILDIQLAYWGGGGGEGRFSIC